MFDFFEPPAPPPAPTQTQLIPGCILTFRVAYPSPLAIYSPSRTKPIPAEGWDQNPQSVNANARLQKNHKIHTTDALAAKTVLAKHRTTEGAIDGQGKVLPSEYPFLPLSLACRY